MYKMNKYREQNGIKLFSIMPIRRGFIPMSIRITNTSFLHMIRNDKEFGHYKTLEKAKTESKKRTQSGEVKNVTSQIGIYMNIFTN
jgi:hypothetical protein